MEVIEYFTLSIVISVSMVTVLHLIKGNRKLRDNSWTHMAKKLFRWLAYAAARASCRTGRLLLKLASDQSGPNPQVQILWAKDSPDETASRSNSEEVVENQQAVNEKKSKRWSAWMQCYLQELKDIVSDGNDLKENQNGDPNFDSPSAERIRRRMDRLQRIERLQQRLVSPVCSKKSGLVSKPSKVAAVGVASAPVNVLHRAVQVTTAPSAPEPVAATKSEATSCEEKHDDIDGRFQTYDSRLQAVELIQKSVLEKLSATEEILMSINTKLTGEGCLEVRPMDMPSAPEFREAEMCLKKDVPKTPVTLPEDITAIVKQLREEMVLRPMNPTVANA